MSTDTEQLVVQLEARIDQFEKSFKRANKTANDNWRQIENRGKQASFNIGREFDKFGEKMLSSVTKLGGTLAGTLGVSGITGAGLLATLVTINGELAKMGSLAKTANLSTDRLQEVKFAANMGGVSDDVLAGDIGTSLHLLDEAQRQVNSLSRLFVANGKSIRDSNGDLIKFDQLLTVAADLMSHAKSNAAKAQIAEMLGLSRDWISVLEKGPDAFSKLTSEAKSAGYVVDAATIQKAKDFDRAWQQAVVRFKAGFISAFSDIAAAFGDFIQDLLNDMPGGEWIRNAFRGWTKGLKDMSLPELEEALKNAVEKGIGGGAYADAIFEEIQKRSNKKPVRINIDLQSKGPTTIIPTDAQKNAFERSVLETQKRIAQTDADTRSVGLNSEARERARVVAELETAAKKANKDAGYQSAIVTDAQRQKINQLADAMEAAAKRQREAQESFKSFNEVLQFGGNIAVDFIDKLGDKTAKLSDLVTSALSMVKKAALQAALLGDGPLAGIFGTKSTNGGTGGIFGAIGKLFGFANGGIMTSRGPVPLRRYENGGVANTPQLAMFGEGKRPEAYVPLPDGRTIPVTMDAPKIDTPALAGPQTVVNSPTINMPITVNANGGTTAQNKDLAAQVASQVKPMAQQMITQEINRQMRPGGIIANGRR